MSTAGSTKKAVQRYSLLPGVEIDEIRQAIVANDSMVVIQLTHGKVVVVREPQMYPVHDRGICKWILVSADAAVRIVFMKSPEGWYISSKKGAELVSVSGTR